jgi:predicted dinucleotide-binding enzyme
MKIAILGSGNVGGTLAKKWAKAGHTLSFGVRNPQKPEVQQLVRTLGSGASASSIATAIDSGEVVLFAIPGGAMEQTIASNAKALDGKIVIDAANNMGGASLNSFSAFASHTPAARAYRAFNIYGWENFENPAFDGMSADLFYCGPDGESRSTMDKLISEVGLNPVYVGGPQQVELVDNVLKLWFALGSGQHMGRHLAFKVLKR